MFQYINRKEQMIISVYREVTEVKDIVREIKGREFNRIEKKRVQ